VVACPPLDAQLLDLPDLHLPDLQLRDLRLPDLPRLLRMIVWLMQLERRRPALNTGG
jgi:hypothetical protein